MFNHSELEHLYMGENLKHSNELTEFFCLVWLYGLEIRDMLLHK